MAMHGRGVATTEAASLWLASGTVLAAVEAAVLAVAGVLVLGVPVLAALALLSWVAMIVSSAGRSSSRVFADAHAWARSGVGWTVMICSVTHGFPSAVMHTDQK